MAGCGRLHFQQHRRANTELEAMDCLIKLAKPGMSLPCCAEDGLLGIAAELQWRSGWLWLDADLLINGHLGTFYHGGHKKLN